MIWPLEGPLWDLLLFCFRLLEQISKSKQAEKDEKNMRRLEDKTTRLLSAFVVFLHRPR